MPRDRNNDDDIVNILTARNFHARFPATAALEGYWQDLSGDQSIPFRADLDPRQIEAVLEYAFVLERIAPGVCRFRLAGRHLNDLMGQEVRGMPATALFEPEYRIEISKLLEKTCADGALVETILTAPAGFGRGALNARLFLAPLRDDSGQVARIFGGLQSLGAIGRQPRRFSIMHTVTKNPDFARAPREKPPARKFAGFAEPEAGFNHQSETQERQQDDTPEAMCGLRLVVDNS